MKDNEKIDKTQDKTQEETKDETQQEKPKSFFRVRLNRNVCFTEKNMLKLVKAVEKSGKTFNGFINCLIADALKDVEINEVKNG